MKEQTDDETELRRYLLGELTQEERARVEERLFLSSDYFQQMQAAADDLIDDYVYEELSAADRGRFETYFLAQPGRREDIKIAKALRVYISAEARPSLSAQSPADADLPLPPAAKSKFTALPFWRNFNPLARLSLAAAVLIILAVGLWLIIKAVRSRDPSAPTQAQQPAPQQTTPPRQRGVDVPANSQPDEGPGPEREQRAGQGNQGASQPQVANRTKTGREPSSEGRELAGRTLAVMLIPGSGSRGGGGVNQVVLQRDVRLVKLRLGLLGGDEYPNYLATIETNGRAIFTKPGLKSTAAGSARVVSLPVRAALLPPASYLLKLRGVTEQGEARDLHTYAFQVETK